MNEIDYPIDFDVALSIVNSIFVMTTKKYNSSINKKEKKKLKQDITMLHKEKEMLYGTDKYACLSVMDKVVKTYSPILKARYAK